MNVRGIESRILREIDIERGITIGIEIEIGIAIAGTGKKIVTETETDIIEITETETETETDETLTVDPKVLPLLAIAQAASPHDALQPHHHHHQTNQQLHPAYSVAKPHQPISTATTPPT